MISKIILTLFFALLGIRPFLSSSTFPVADIFYSIGLIAVSSLVFANRAKNLKKNPASFFVLLFLGAILLSLSFSKNIELSLGQFYRYTAFFLVFFTVSSLAPNEKKTLVLALRISCGLVSLYALRWLLNSLTYTIDYLKIHPYGSDFALEYLSRGRAFVPFITPNALAGYLILFTPLSFLFLFESNKAPRKSLMNILALSAFLLNAVVLLATQSLGAIFSLMAALFISILKEKKNIKKGLIVSSLAFFAAVIVFLFFLRNSNPYDFNRPLFSILNRLAYWKQALFQISFHPFIGFGLGDYPFFKSISPHNSFLQLWAETGILGVAAFACLAARTLKIDFLKIPERERRLALGLWIGSLAFLIHNLLDFTFFYPEVCLQWWAIAALVTTF